MFDADDFLRDFLIAIAVVGVSAGSFFSVNLCLSQIEHGLVPAILVGAVWVYISFRLVRFFRMWTLRDEIYRKEFHLKYMGLDDPWRREFIDMRNVAATKLKQLEQD